MRGRARLNGVYAGPAGGPMRLTCPKCGARPGWKCTRTTALDVVVSLSKVHDERMRAARDAGYRPPGRKAPEGSARGATPVEGETPNAVRGTPETVPPPVPPGAVTTPTGVHGAVTQAPGVHGDDG